MELIEILKNRIVEHLEFADALVFKIEENKPIITANIKEVIRVDKAGENPFDLINQHRILIAMNFLLDNDLNKVINELSVLYKLAKISNIELNLEEKDINRLEANSNISHYHFVKGKTGIEPKISNLEENIRNGILAKKEFTPAKFLEDLRKSPMYNEENT